MNPSEKYDNYPFWIVLLSNLHSLLMYGLGFLVMLKLGLIPAIGYIVFVLILEIRIIKNHCVDCYYWGKICGFGKGKISALFFRKGDISKFCLHEMTWKNMIPDMLVSVTPIIAGVILLCIDFDIKYLIFIILIIALTTFGNGFIRGKLTCKFCKQREIGCSADKLFNKE
ncbi:MAG: hypothetical protein A2W99_08715 [Bacteroidetes bacterium GWF2_33_16]|nr:MAG: hypothetical protein A2X00_00440 [Bacteroidetes bacterium GWE2_32_14]OFY05582.1 MAG: hypothetical protein A2W99_08715 [Bacteroidetes bacterium GWF2_33_16]